MGNSTSKRIRWRMILAGNFLFYAFTGSDGRLFAFAALIFLCLFSIKRKKQDNFFNGPV